MEPRDDILLTTSDPGRDIPNPIEALHAWKLSGGPRIQNEQSAWFYKSFKTLRPTRQAICLSVDISGDTRQCPVPGLPWLSALELSVIFAMSLCRMEDSYHVVVFSGADMLPFNIHKSHIFHGIYDRFCDLVPMQVDSSSPVVWALRNKIPVEAFITLSGYPWAPNHRPASILQRYRHWTGHETKMVNVSTLDDEPFGFAERDGMLDIYDCDTRVLDRVFDFIREE